MWKWKIVGFCGRRKRPSAIVMRVAVTPIPRALNVTLDEVGLKSQGEKQACRRGDLNPHAPKGTSPSS
jgi:hypothetical protein